ncbi:MAG: tetratricopeptide repeat protein [Thiobacillaceae bacterium]
MSKKMILGLFLLVSTAVGGVTSYAADPTIQQVYRAAENGRMADAQTMMEQVLREHPDSAKAHFVEAELLTKQGRFNDARTELAKAERLAPGLPFAKPQSVQSLNSRLSGSNALAGMTSHPLRPIPNHPSPWSLLVIGAGLLVLILVAVRFIMRGSAMPAVSSPGSGTTTPMQPYPAGGMGSPGGGVGSGILGGLATGAAVGAGMVAGEELMHHFLDGNPNSSHAVPPANADHFTPPQNDMGGQDFGISDGSWDDGSSMGGDDWN